MPFDNLDTLINGVGTFLCKLFNMFIFSTSVKNLLNEAVLLKLSHISFKPSHIIEGETH